MHRFYFALILLLIFGSSRSTSHEPHQKPEQLWSWFGDCSGPKYMGFELWMNDAMIHKTSFPICPITDRSEENPHDKILVFFFKGGYVFQGEYHTKPTQRIEGNIWQAGTDGGDIILGVSFSAPGRHGQILLNTIHVANPEKESRTEIDRSLVVHTFPIQHKEQSQQ